MAVNTPNESLKTPVALIILDGWGHRENTEGNAIYHANTPHWDKLWQQAPHTLISGSGLDVGLPEGQMGNSEVGHMSIGSGRIVYQSITRIDKAIDNGEFFQNKVYQAAINKAACADKAVHILGLLSPGGVHSHESHIQAIVKMAAQCGASKIYLHAFLDGRDTLPRSAQASIELLNDSFMQLEQEGVKSARIASIVGRYYAMDRDNRWDRVEQAYQMLTEGKCEHTATNAVDALLDAYNRDENDEFVLPTCILDSNGEAALIEDGDAVIFMNFRADRAREITRAFVEDDFAGFNRNCRPNLADFVMTTEYAADIDAACAFQPASLTNVLGDYVSSQGMTQLRIAETEKYAHVTFFFSGGRESAFDGEERILIPSPDVATYNLQPEMSAAILTENLVDAIKSRKHNIIVCNYANGDMVGHTGDFDAAVKAVEAVDQCIGQVVAALQEVGGECLITADHGNCEQMFDSESGQANTAHTCELVPLVYSGERQFTFCETGGRLSDIAPTLLYLMDLEQPAEMSGSNLIES